MKAKTKPKKKQSAKRKRSTKMAASRSARASTPLSESLTMAGCPTLPGEPGRTPDLAEGDRETIDLRLAEEEERQRASRRTNRPQK